MDTKRNPEEMKAKVASDLERIKTHMPGVYKAINERAGLVGSKVYGYVKRACAGEPNAFCACEDGHVVGTPFTYEDISAHLAMGLVLYGMDCIAIFSPDLLPTHAQMEVAHGKA